MKQIQKIDIFLFKTFSKLVMRWIKKQNFQKHKYDFFIMVRQWVIAYCASLILMIFGAAILLHKRELIIAGFIIIVLLLFAEGLHFKILKLQKEEHDILWLHRKNPLVYQAIKHKTEVLWELREKSRLISLAIHFAIIIFLASQWSQLVLLPVIIVTPEIYGSYIFDFDEPEKKDKKVQDELTELQKGSWKNLIRDLVPKGV